MPLSKRKSASSSATQPQQRQRVQESNANPAARPAPSTVSSTVSSTASSTASTGPSPPPAPKVNGRYLVDVFDHIITSVPSYKDKWFTVDDWCGALKGHQDLVTKAIPVFNREMKNMRTYGGVDAQTKYFEDNKYGVFSNVYEFKDNGRGKSTKSCYLFTTPGSQCPLPPPPTGFTPSNINEIHVSPRTVEAATVGMPTPSPSTTDNRGVTQIQEVLQIHEVLQIQQTIRQLLPKQPQQEFPHIRHL